MNAADPADPEAALARCEQTHGPAHPDTLAARLALARHRRTAGDLAGAESQLWQVLREQERAEGLGPDHADTVATRNQLALVVHARGRLKDAGELFAQVLAAEERALGADHPQTQTTRARLQATRATQQVGSALLGFGVALLAALALGLWWLLR